MNITHHDPCEQMIDAIELFSNLFRKYPNYIRTLVIVLYSIVCTVGASGSFLVIIAVLRKPQMRQLHNFFIVNLALSDLMLCTFAVPLTAFLTLNAYWIFGEVPCKLTSFGSGVNLFVSSMSISAIGMDRYWAVIFPTKAYLQRIVMGACFVVIWLISMTLASPQYFMTKLNIKNKCDMTLQVCHENWTPYPTWQKSYTIGCMLFQYILPLAMLIFLYGQIMARLRKRSAIGRTSSSNIRKHLANVSREKKRNNLFICIVMAFALGWLPFNLFNVLNAFKILQYEVAVFAFTHIIGITSACINPILYGVFNENFRREFVELLAITKITSIYSRLVRFLLTRLGTTGPTFTIENSTHDDGPDTKKKSQSCSSHSSFMLKSKLSRGVVRPNSDKVLTEMVDRCDQCCEKQTFLDQDDL